MHDSRMTENVSIFSLQSSFIRNMQDLQAAD